MFGIKNVYNYKTKQRSLNYDFEKANGLLVYSLQDKYLKAIFNDFP